MKLSDSHDYQLKHCVEMADLYFDYLEKMEELEKRIAEGTEKCDPDGSALLLQFRQELEKFRMKDL